LFSELDILGSGGGGASLAAEEIRGGSALLSDVSVLCSSLVLTKTEHT
jgi:hypothetical protein